MGRLRRGYQTPRVEKRVGSGAQVIVLGPRTVISWHAALARSPLLFGYTWNYGLGIRRRNAWTLPPSDFSLLGVLSSV
jgi:hypothetical protein